MDRSFADNVMSVVCFICFPLLHCPFPDDLVASRGDFLVHCLNPAAASQVDLALNFLAIHHLYHILSNRSHSPGIGLQRELVVGIALEVILVESVASTHISVVVLQGITVHFLPFP